ncbi:MAG: acetyl-CoA decarbonylase/synthase complex subunit gamma [Armatimonadia bacterium]|nr:acetyl-CoA decarbonylase/synthase complex subunit gamma [Armatimonadia bacterium]
MTGLEIYALLPQTNCKDCGKPTCLAFALGIASGQEVASDCPHLSDEAKDVLLESSLPPVLRVTAGPEAAPLELGGEKEIYRHESKFVQPTVLAVSVPVEGGDQAEVTSRVEEIKALTFERIGEEIGVTAAAFMCGQGATAEDVRHGLQLAEDAGLAPLLLCTDADVLAECEDALKRSKPVLLGVDESRLDAFTKLGKQTEAPLTLVAPEVDGLVKLADSAKEAGCENLLLEVSGCGALDLVTNLTALRRRAVEDGDRSAGYPLLTKAGSEPLDILRAAAALCRYAGLVIVDSTDPALLFPLAALVQSIYADPQAPATVEAGLHAVGDPGPDAPVLVTTDFALTYYSVEPEVEAAKVPAWILVTDSEGQSVLTAWAAGQFEGSTIAKAINESKAEERLETRELVLPGQVAVIQGDVEDETGWSVRVGPREATGIPGFLRELAEAKTPEGSASDG